MFCSLADRIIIMSSEQIISTVHITPEFYRYNQYSIHVGPKSGHYKDLSSELHAADRIQMNHVGVTCCFTEVLRRHLSRMEGLGNGVA